MKADQSGTLTEQRLFRMGYKTASQRPQCGNCKHHDYSVGGSSWSETIRYQCKKGPFTTTKNSICNEWEAK